MSSSEQLICLVCGSGLRLFGPRAGYRYYRCPECGTLQLAPLPDGDSLQALYSHRYAESHTPELSDPEWWGRSGAPYRRCLLEALQPLAVTGPVLDFGCGWGHLCRDLQAHGYSCEGIDMSAPMIDYCVRQQGIPAVRADLDYLAQRPRQYQALVLCAVFEHLVDHARHLEHFHNALQEGGYFISLQPTAGLYTLAGWLLRLGNVNRELPELHGSFAPPWHTALFSLHGMQQLCARHGFVLRRVIPAPQGRMGGPLGLVQWMLGLSNTVGGFLCGLRWPLYTAHVFVFQKRGGL